MLEFKDACELLFNNIARLGSEECLIEDAVARALAQDVVSPMDITPFRNSAMDGFAVKSSWLKDCSVDHPVELPIGSTAFAGDPAPRVDAGSQVLKIMTGACVPDEYDSVIPIEDTKYDDDTVRFFKPVVSGRHVRSPGEDITRGQKLFAAGYVLTRLDIGILAAIGLRSVSTFQRSSLLIIGTGNELIDPGEELAEGKIYDSNTYMISSLVSPLCSKIECVRRVPDRREELQKALDSGHDVIVTSGGVSMGDRDLVVEMAESRGWRSVFHKVRIKPGKPVYFAVRGRQILLGLPGNPLSAAITCCLFLIPALKKMAGFDDYRLRGHAVSLAPGSFRKSNRMLIWPGLMDEKNGQAFVRYSPKTSSSALTALQDSDGLIIQKTDKEESRDQKVDFIPWNQILM
jgi:molybdopterin molybdotransferase